MATKRQGWLNLKGNGLLSRSLLVFPRKEKSIRGKEEKMIR
jgi:hypothetical protein